MQWLQERGDGGDSDEEEAPELTQWEAIAWLAILTIWVSLLSGYLVDAIQVMSTVISVCSIRYANFYLN